MKQKKIETHKIGLVGQAPSRRGDPRKPLAGPNGQKIARLVGMSYEELIACRRRHLNTHYNGKRGKGDAFDRTKGNLKAADVLLDWRVERNVLLGKNVARCFGFRDLPFLAEISIYGRRFLIFPHPSGTNRWWNERRNERRARQLLQRFLRGETVSLDSERVDVPLRRGLVRLMQTAAKAAEHAAEKPPLDVSNTSQLRDLAQSAARIFGWDNNDKPGVQLNQQFVISQEQLEQIRQLRATED